jgi:hypothetical protein
MPPITDTNADDWRGRDGPIAKFRTAATQPAVSITTPLASGDPIAVIIATRTILHRLEGAQNGGVPGNVVSLLRVLNSRPDIP